MTEEEYQAELKYARQLAGLEPLDGEEEEYLILAGLADPVIEKPKELTVKEILAKNYKRDIKFDNELIDLFKRDNSNETPIANTVVNDMSATPIRKDNTDKLKDFEDDL